MSSEVKILVSEVKSKYPEIYAVLQTMVSDNSGLRKIDDECSVEDDGKLDKYKTLIQDTDKYLSELPEEHELAMDVSEFYALGYSVEDKDNQLPVEIKTLPYLEDFNLYLNGRFNDMTDWATTRHLKDYDS